MNNRTRFSLSLATVGAAALLLGGCTSTYDEVKANPSPDLDTLYERPSDIDNAVVVTFDENGRMFWEDLGRAFYWNRPSRLTREPIPLP